MKKLNLLSRFVFSRGLSSCGIIELLLSLVGLGGFLVLLDIFSNVFVIDIIVVLLSVEIVSVVIVDDVVVVVVVVWEEVVMEIFG